MLAGLQFDILVNSKMQHVYAPLRQKQVLDSVVNLDSQEVTAVAQINHYTVEEFIFFAMFNSVRCLITSKSSIYATV